VVSPDDWKRQWPQVHLQLGLDCPELPPIARGFLLTHGLSKVVGFEAEGNNTSLAFERSFEPLHRPLISYNKLIRWDIDTPDRRLYKLWDSQLAIVEEEFCNGHASICVHRTEEYITRIDCEV
jgi:hypothetical protein